MSVGSHIDSQNRIINDIGRRTRAAEIDKGFQILNKYISIQQKIFNILSYWKPLSELCELFKNYECLDLQFPFSFVGRFSCNIVSKQMYFVLLNVLISFPHSTPEPIVFVL